MLSLNNSPIAWLNRPYFDLGPSNGGAIHVSGIEISYRSLIEDKLYNGLQASLCSKFRKKLIKETGLVQYEANNPLQLSVELRTERWQKLCDYLSHYQELKPLTQFNLIDLLNRLCFYQVVLDYVPEISQEEIASNPFLARIASRRVFAKMMLGFDSVSYDFINDFEMIANSTSSGSLAKINCILLLVVQYAKTFSNLEKAKYWREVAEKEIQAVKEKVDDFVYQVLISIYYRSVVFIPLLQGNKEQVVREMDLSESYANSVKGKDKWQEILAEENRTVLFESRTKEALWLRDFDLAEERARQLVQKDPLDPKYHVELGEVLFKQNKLEKALNSYRSAIRLGAPYTEISWFMAGQCYHLLGDLEMACDYYLNCLKCDPLAISAVQQLAELSPHLGEPTLVNWSNLRLTELKQRQQQQKLAQSAKIKKLAYA